MPGSIRTVVGFLTLLCAWGMMEAGLAQFVAAGIGGAIMTFGLQRIATSKKF